MGSQPQNSKKKKRRRQILKTIIEVFINEETQHERSWSSMRKRERLKMEMQGYKSLFFLRERMKMEMQGYKSLFFFLFST